MHVEILADQFESIGLHRNFQNEIADFLFCDSNNFFNHLIFILRVIEHSKVMHCVLKTVNQKHSLEVCISFSFRSHF